MTQYSLMFPLLQDQFPLVQPSKIAFFIIQFISHLNFIKCSHIFLFDIISGRLVFLTEQDIPINA